MKRILEVDDEEGVILLRPGKNAEGDWNHSTNIHFPKKHDDSYGMVDAISDLARAMVGFSYCGDNEEIVEYAAHFYNLIKTPAEQKEKTVKKDNVIYFNQWGNDD